jgi:hypothetical protein
VSELKWLDGYSGQSTDELIALEGKYRTDSLVVAFHMAMSQKAARIGEENLTEEERIILAIEALETEVNAGGYDQFFRNSSKEYVPLIADALRRIGCSKAATLTRHAIRALGIQEPLTVKAIDRAMELDDPIRTEKLAECDKRYFDTVGDLAESVLEFIKKNRSEIKL